MKPVYLPQHLNIETSDLCNRSCAFCPVQRDRDKSPARLLDPALYARLLDELASWERDLTVSLQWIDEPLANPDFLAYAREGRERLPHARWVLQTNGDLLDDQTAAALKPLFDAVVINLYARSAARRLARMDLDVTWAKFDKRIQHPGRLQRPAGARFDEAVFHANHKYGRADWIDWKDAVRRRGREWCSSVFEQAAIGWDGQVYACCRDNEKTHPVGDLREHSLAEAYNSDAARALRAMMQAGARGMIDMCRACDKAFKRPFDVERVDAGKAHVDDAMPFGSYDYLDARALAKARGHLALPGFRPRSYERVVGLTPALAEGIVRTLASVLGDALHSVWVCGGRVMARRRLALVDPSVFLPPEGTLTVGKKGRLREYGRDPLLSSDLDLKVFVRSDFVVEDQDAVELALGAALEDLGAPFPISGNPTPRARLLAAAPDATPRAAFLAYNAQRPKALNKGPLSTAYAQLLSTGGRVFTGDATAPVRAQLTARGREVSLSDLVLDEETARLPEAECFSREASGLSYHQLVCALLDFPALHPRGVVVEGGRVVAGGLGVRAARAAGRAGILVP